MRIGVDLGGTKIEIIALGDRREELTRRRIVTPQGNYAGTLDAIVVLVRDLERDLGESGSVGIGTPGAASPLTGLIKNANSTALIGNNFERDVSEKLQRPVRVANDANCFVLSEAVDGAGAGAAVVFGAILGTGVGGGIAVNARSLEGRNRIAGEWGHIPLPWPRDDERPGPACYCGKVGCIETWLSGPGLSEQYFLRSGLRLHASRLEEAASAGDIAAEQCLHDYSDRLARGLSVVVNILDPDTIVLGGGLSNLARLYSTLPALLPRYVLSGEVQTRIHRAVHGDSSGVRGAAMLWPSLKDAEERVL